LETTADSVIQTDNTLDIVDRNDRRATFVFAAVALIILGFFIFYISNIALYAAIGSALIGDVYIFLFYRNSSWRKNAIRARLTNSKSIPPIYFIVLGSPTIVLTFLDIHKLMGGSLPIIVLNSIMVFGFSITFFFVTFTIPLAIVHTKEESMDMNVQHDYHPLVSILIPAYNEEKVISRSLDSLLELKYDKKEIIVIDDGSKDKTATLVSYYAHNYPNAVKLLRRPNGGKARAMNYGLLFARGQIVVIMDADSCLDRNAIDRVVSIMSDKNVHAVCGNIEALNRKSFLTKCQALEYITSENILRTSFARPGAIGVLPGAFSAFRRKDVLELGAYDPDNIAEDFDLTIKLHKVYADTGKLEATSAGTAYTEVPPTLCSLYRQRMRWYLGTFQAMAKHKDVYWNQRYGLLHSIIYPTITLSLILPFVTFASIVTGIVLILRGQGGSFLSILGLFMLAQVFIALLAISLDRGGKGHIDGYSLAWYSIFLSIGYRQIIDFFTIVAILKFIFSTKARKSLHWTRVERVGTTSPPQ
jgi:cellulose synthase/poly-beta-1,6-N-acetylglucosamine synthase-like glycosyltransferase